MKPTRLDINDFIELLENLRDESSVETIILTEHEGFPAVLDADNPELIYVFKTFEGDEESELH